MDCPGSYRIAIPRALLEKLGLTNAPEFQNPLNSENWGAAKSRLAAVFITHNQAHWRKLLENPDALFSRRS
ncbi:MAG: hypothetical protein CM1200mP41_26760 [Gammaproteobacteria bacterium]|nr:MAG: hypothetical protein CM1200mP41_26760 [Gammaproteobacteria bacterium]